MAHQCVRPYRVKICTFIYAALASVSLLLSLTACAWIGQTETPETKLVIPDFQSAKEQYGFASIYNGAMIPSTDAERRAEQVRRLMQCYERVVSNFPDERSFTPLARLEIADCSQALGKMKEARAQYEEIMADYPENDYVQARGLFSIAMTVESEGDFEQCKSIYRQIREEFGNNQNPGVQGIVKKADALYYKVRHSGTKGKPGKK